jgi:hypothetical protein
MPGWYEVLRAPGGGLVAVPVGPGAVPVVLRPLHARVLLPVGSAGGPGIPFFAADYRRQGYRVVLRVSADRPSADVYAWRPGREKVPGPRP